MPEKPEASELADWLILQMNASTDGESGVITINVHRIKRIVKELRRLGAGEKAVLDFLGGEYEGTFGEYLTFTLAHKQQVIDDYAKLIGKSGEQLVRIDKLEKMRTHCENCGADYLQTGVEDGCPCKLLARIAELEEAGKWLLERYNKNRRASVSRDFYEEEQQEKIEQLLAKEPTDG